MAIEQQTYEELQRDEEQGLIPTEVSAKSTRTWLVRGVAGALLLSAALLAALYRPVFLKAPVQLAEEKFATTVLACEEGHMHQCPSEWKDKGNAGGYHCLHKLARQTSEAAYQSSGGACRPAKDGPFPSADCHVQCGIGRAGTSGSGSGGSPKPGDAHYHWHSGSGGHYHWHSGSGGSPVPGDAHYHWHSGSGGSPIPGDAHYHWHSGSGGSPISGDAHYHWHSGSGGSPIPGDAHYHWHSGSGGSPISGDSHYHWHSGSGGSPILDDHAGDFGHSHHHWHSGGSGSWHGSGGSWHGSGGSGSWHGSGGSGSWHGSGGGSWHGSGGSGSGSSGGSGSHGSGGSSSSSGHSFSCPEGHVHQCPAEWKQEGNAGGYHCLHKLARQTSQAAYESSGGACRPAKDGPFPVADCQVQCGIGAAGKKVPLLKKK